MGPLSEKSHVSVYRLLLGLAKQIGHTQRIVEKKQEAFSFT